MRDTRSTEIKRILRKVFPTAKFSVRIDKYSMGESINIHTDLIQYIKEADPRGYGYIEKITKESKEHHEKMKELLKDFESVDRDQFGEILSGGNTYLFIDGR